MTDEQLFTHLMAQPVPQPAPDPEPGGGETGHDEARTDSDYGGGETGDGEEPPDDPGDDCAEPDDGRSDQPDDRHGTGDADTSTPEPDDWHGTGDADSCTPEPDRDERPEPGVDAQDPQEPEEIARTWSGGVRGRGLRLLVGLTTIAGLDRRPGELLGFGFVHAELARRISATAARSWHYALVQPHGTPIQVGPIRRRPTGDWVEGHIPDYRHL